MNNLENTLAKEFNKKYCCFTGSGTTAIYIVLKALNMQNKKILYPSITCTVPINAAIYAGYEPIFCDVNLENYTMGIDSLKKMINMYDVGVIVPTHIYGHRCDMDNILKIAKEKNIFVLEDAAQTINFSETDTSIISFGHTKIFECKDGGGAVFTDNEELYIKLKNEIKNLLLKPVNLDKLFDKYRVDYYDIVNSDLKKEEKENKLLELQIKNKNTFIYHIKDNKYIEDKLKQKRLIIQERKKREELYDKYLDKSLIDRKVQNLNEPKWRYSFLFRGNRNELLKKVRDKNVDISSWYPALHKIYSEQSDKYFINSNYIERQIVNLWLDINYSKEKIIKDINIINNIMKGM